MLTIESRSLSLANRTTRHPAIVRLTHWITVLCFFALLVSGIEILISHPRFYWGEVGNSLSSPLFKVPIPYSRRTVPTGYDFVLPDQNGWSRYLHFEAAWALVTTGIIYTVFGSWTGHFRKNLVPDKAARTWPAFRRVIAQHLHLAPPDETTAHTYNVLQRMTYLAVIFVLFPLMIWTGLALSPTLNAAAPWVVNALGGRQTARTLHFLVSVVLVVFLAVHVVIVVFTGFAVRMREMITATASVPKGER